MVIKPARIPGRPPSIYKYSQRKNAYTLVGRQSIYLSGVDRYDHGNYSCKALYLENFESKKVQEDVLLLVKGEILKLSFDKMITVEPFITDTPIIRTPLYYGRQFTGPKVTKIRDINSTSVIRTLP